MKGVDIDPVDLGLDLWPGVQPRLLGAPVIGRRPIVQEAGQPGDVDPIAPTRIVGRGGRQLGGGHGGPDAVELGLRHVDAEGAGEIHIDGH